MPFIHRTASSSVTDARRRSASRPTGPTKPSESMSFSVGWTFAGMSPFAGIVTLPKTLPVSKSIVVSS